MMIKSSLFEQQILSEQQSVFINFNFFILNKENSNNYLSGKIVGNWLTTKSPFKTLMHKSGHSFQIIFI